eukprot:g61379.t1
MALQAALEAFRVGQHDVLTKFVANYEGKSLDLSSKNLGDVGASAVAKGLQVNKSITTLNLNLNNIGPDGAAAIGKALEVNKTLQALGLSSNNIGDDGAKAIGKALELDYSFVFLGNMYLYECATARRGLCLAKEANAELLPMLKLLPRRSTDVTLEWSCTLANDIGYQGAAAFADALKINTSLREVLGVHFEESQGTACCLIWFTCMIQANTLYAKLEQNDLQGRKSQFMADFFRAVKGSGEKFNRFMEMPDIKTAEKSKATPDILLQNAARVGLLTACKVLIDSKEFEFDKPAARDAGVGSSDSATREYFITYGFDLYLGRYRRAPEPAYESPTCSVWMAKDMKAENAKVALKVIKAGVPGAQDNFEREVHSREMLGSLPGLVLPLISTYADELCLVMPAGDYSLAEFLRRRDIPGRDVNKVQEIMLQITACLEELHRRHLVHGDIKPNNIIRIGNKFVLIDFDAAAEFGKHVGVKYSTSYCEPQLAAVVARRQVQGKDQRQVEKSKLPLADGAFDVFSLGVILYELCTGKQLFPHIKDNIEEAEELRQFCVWAGVSDHHLSSVFSAASVPESVRTDARHLIRWCLQPERKDRPSLEQIKSHRFLGGPALPPPPKEWSDFKRILKTGTVRMSYHFFISYMQVEAAGDVGTLSSELRKLGAYVWRDMDAKDLTEEGMCQGVADSDVVILFQTNGVLSRPYCLKEIWWALLLKKPLVIVSELDERFFPFDFLRWTQDRLQKLPGWDQWAVSHNLGSTYKDCLLNYKRLHDVVKQRWDSGNFIPFRRRNFEVNAMVREIFAQAGQNSCAWGARLPPQALPQPSDFKAQSTWPRVFVIRGEQGRAMASELCGALQDLYPGLVLHTSDEPDVPAELKSAERVVVLLTTGVLAERSSSMTHLRYAVQNAKPLFALYSEEAGWEFGGRESRNAAQWVMSVVGELEAMVFRPKAQREYESLAMCDELVRRMVSPFTRLDPLTEKQVAAAEAKERAQRAANPIAQASAPVAGNYKLKANSLDHDHFHATWRLLYLFSNVSTAFAWVKRTVGRPCYRKSSSSLRRARPRQTPGDRLGSLREADSVHELDLYDTDSYLITTTV